MRRVFRKEFWKQGSGDIIGFLCVLPCIIFMLVLLISMVQIGSIKERLEYTAYLACRQAVVASDRNNNGTCMDDAQKIATQTAMDDLEMSDLKFIPGSIKVKVELVDDEETAKSDFDTIPIDKVLSKKKKSKKDEVEWEKGNYAKCTVSVKIESVTPFLSGTRSASIVMMIEKPAAEGTDYPWFDNI